MYSDQFAATRSARLRFVFGSSPVPQDAADRATYGDIARTFDETTRMRHGNPIAVDVRYGSDSTRCQAVSDLGASGVPFG